MTNDQQAALDAIDAARTALDVASGAIAAASSTLRASLDDAQPPPPPPPTTESVLHRAAATLAPGEWCRVPTQLPDGAANFKTFQTVSNAAGSADGMGWTDRLIEHKGKLMMPLMRDVFDKAIAIMTPAGRWSRIEEPAGFDPAKKERRPFDRWFVEGEYACFAPADAKPAMGYVLRTPLDNPGVFERDGIAIGDSQMDSVGNFAMCAAWGRRFAYTPGAKLRSWAAGETSWREHSAQVPQEQKSTGYAGKVIYNPVRNEVLAIGGQYFGSQADSSDRGLIVSGPDAQAVPFLARFEDGSRVLRVTAAAVRLLVHPVTGEYLMLHLDGIVYRSETGEFWRQYQDLRQIRPWGKYESYMPWCHLSNTPDVIVAVSHIEGAWLHRMLEN